MHMRKNSHTTHKFLLSFTWIAMVLYGAINVLLAFFLKGIVDSATEQNMDLFLCSSIATLLLVVFEFLMGNASRYLLQLFCKKNLLSQKICRYRNALYASAVDHIDISTFSTDIELLYSHYYVNIALMACYISQLILSAAGIIYLNWKVAVVVLVTTILPFVIPMLFSKKLQSSTESYKSAADAYLNFVQDSLNGLQEIRTYRAFSFFLKKHTQRNENTEHQRLKNQMWISFSNTFSSFISTLSFVAILVYCGYLTLKGQTTIGALIAVIQLMNTIIAPVAQISGAIGQIQATKKLVHSADTEVSSEKQTFQRQVSEITLENAAFSYDGQHPVLQNLNLHLQHGKRYAITGESGSGKSTLAKLLSGAVKGYSGQMQAFDADGKPLSAKELPYHIQYVSQEPYLFRLSARDNVYLGADEDEKIWQEKMKNLNMDCFLEENSDELANRDRISGGQKQRLVIARALSHKTDVLILDEPTANLDHATAYKVMDYIVHSPCGILVVITHDTSSEILSLFDEVIRL